MSGFCIRTRLLEQKGKDAYVAWGADYWPLPEKISRAVGGPFLHPGKADPELGIPAILPTDGWLAKAVRLDAGEARITQYEYTAGSYRLFPNLTQVKEGIVDVPFDSLETAHMRAGFGFNRHVSSSLGKYSDIGPEGLQEMTAVLGQLLQEQTEANQ